MSQENFGHKQRAPRERWLLPGLLRTDRLETCKFTVRNISPYGLGGICRELPPEVGEKIEIRLPVNYCTFATVCWLDGQAFGVRFDEPIDLNLVVNSFQRSRDLTERKTAWEVKSRHRVTDYRPDTAKLRRV